MIDFKFITHIWTVKKNTELRGLCNGEVFI
jgi:hypothetical protein